MLAAESGTHVARDDGYEARRFDGVVHMQAIQDINRSRAGVGPYNFIKLLNFYYQNS